MHSTTTTPNQSTARTPLPRRRTPPRGAGPWTSRRAAGAARARASPPCARAPQRGDARGARAWESCGTDRWLEACARGCFRLSHSEVILPQLVPQTFEGLALAMTNEKWNALATDRPCGPSPIARERPASACALRAQPHTPRWCTRSPRDTAPPSRRSPAKGPSPWSKHNSQSSTI